MRHRRNSGTLPTRRRIAAVIQGWCEMGAWGSGLLENDAAADLVGFWNEFIAHGRQVDPEFWTSERIYELFRQTQLRALRDIDFIDSDRASEILAIGVLYLQNELPLPTQLVDVLVRAASAQLERAQLREWGEDARVRRAALQEFLVAIGREAAPALTRVDPDKEELKKMRAFARHYPRWVRTWRALAGDDMWPEFAPPLESDFRRTIMYLRNSDRPASNELVTQRLMCIAFCLGSYLELPEDEVLHLIALAEASKGDIYRRRVPGTVIPTMRERLLG
ncbi:MAG: hypothetical protein ABI969_14020 [bacterium]